MLAVSISRGDDELDHLADQMRENPDAYYADVRQQEPNAVDQEMGWTAKIANLLHRPGERLAP